MISKSYTIPHTVMVQNVDDETLLFDSVTELFFSLNDTGAMFWESMGGHSNLADVHTELLEAFEVEPVQLEDDLATFAALLSEQGLIVFS